MKGFIALSPIQSKLSKDVEKSLKSHDLPSLGIVVCTYQRRELAVNCVRSLDFQAEDIDQIVVVVDGSTDGTSEALKKLKTLVQIRIIEHENIGAAASRNVGARLIDSDVIYFLDDDMEVVAGSLQARRESHANGARVLMGIKHRRRNGLETYCINKFSNQDLKI